MYRHYCVRTGQTPSHKATKNGETYVQTHTVSEQGKSIAIGQNKLKSNRNKTGPRPSKSFCVFKFFQKNTLRPIEKKITIINYKLIL